MNRMDMCSKCRVDKQFKLTSCRHCLQGMYCEEHISPFYHECAALATLVLAESEASNLSALLHVQSYNCSSDGCSNCGPMKLECCMCGKHYCPNHRRHGCMDPLKKELLDKREKREVNRHRFETAKELIDLMVESSIEKHRSLSGSKLATANMIQLMRLKQRAVGRRDIPFALRAYFMVHWRPCATHDLEKKALYFSKNWALTQVIQIAVEQCNLLMNEKYSDTSNLHLFHMDGRLLSKDPSLMLQKLLSENVLIDGGNVLVDKLA